MADYSEELVFVRTEDHLALEGVWIRPAAAPEGGARPAVLWFHGNTSRFCDEPYVHLGRELAGRGLAFLTGNVRAHDMVAPIWGPGGEPVAGGAAWERFAGTRRDVAAWVDHAAGRGYARVVLAGHSFGAARVTYYQAEAADRRVAGLILASPDVRYRVQPERTARAEEWIAAGREDDLLPAPDEAPWYRLSPRTLLDRATVAQHVYSSDSRVPHLATIAVPILAFYGAEEAWLGGQPELDLIRAQAAAAPSVTTRILPGADHAYWGHAAVAADLIAGWLAGLG